MPKNTTERCCEKCKCNHADLPNWRDHFDECKAAQYCHEHNCKCHTTTENGWEERFDEAGFGDQLVVPEGQAKNLRLKTFIQQVAKEEYERGRFEGERDVIGRIERMNIWSKGTAEGTKNDIIFKLHTLYPPLEAALEAPNHQSHD